MEERRMCKWPIFPKKGENRPKSGQDRTTHTPFFQNFADIWWNLNPFLTLRPRQAVSKLGSVHVSFLPFWADSSTSFIIAGRFRRWRSFCTDSCLDGLKPGCRGLRVKGAVHLVREFSRCIVKANFHQWTTNCSPGKSWVEPNFMA